MLIGLDFDNTIVCYDAVFESLAREKRVPEDVAVKGKTAIRDFLRSEGREPEWTMMQGEAYGSRMSAAVAFEGFGKFLEAAAARGHRMVVVSHRTTKPCLGPDFDLHSAARGWWSERDFSGLVSDLYFETTGDLKSRRIGALGCDVFVDDLWEFLERTDLPAGLRRIWFDHGGKSGARNGLERATSWQDVTRLLLG